MNATVKFLSDANAGVAAKSSGIFVPSAAMRERNGKKIVFVLLGGRAVAREVRVKSTRTNGSLVEGLSGGEDLITSGPANLQDGDRVKVKGGS